MNRKVRTVLVGCGGISAAWLKPAVAHPAIEIVGLVDLNEAAARQRAAEFHLEHAAIGTDLETMLHRTTPDAVFDCTVPEAHAAVVTTALRHGCHVLGEKPMADSMANARRMVAAARQAGKLYAVTQTRRYDAQVRRVRAFLDSGAIGPVTMLTSDFFIGAHFGGFRDQMRHVLVLDMAIHTFDSARLFSGADPVAVSCRDWNPAGSWYAHGAAAVALFEMTGGVIYSYRGSWCAEGLPTPWASEWRIVGTRGTLKWNGDDRFQAQVVAKTGGFHSEWRDVEVPPAPADARTGGHQGCIEEFVRCLETGAAPETVCTDNIKSLAMVFGAIESAETGQRVEIPSTNPD